MNNYTTIDGHRHDRTAHVHSGQRGWTPRLHERFWPRHIQSLGKYGIIVHGVSTDTSAPEPRVVAMVGYPPGGDAQRIIQSYRKSRDFIEDHADFDLSLITSVHVATLEPIPGFDTHN
jgi:hypothetical protein